MQESKAYRIVVNQFVAPEKLRFAKQMRTEMTHCEAILWERLRRKGLGVNFRRQQVIYGFIADFYCHSEALVIEVDGVTHDTEYDQERDRIFSERGIRVLRVTNEQVNTRIGFVVSLIKENLKNRNTDKT